MIKLIKIKDVVFQNIEPKTIDENGNEIWNIPSEPEKLKYAVIDTINWLIGREIKKIAETDAKLSASNSKAILLLYKMLKNSCDASNLTEKEQQIIQKFEELIDMGYTDSDLLLDVTQKLITSLEKYSNLISQAQNANTQEELLKILENL